MAKAQLIVLEKLSDDEKEKARKRVVAVTAESVTIGTQEACDIQVRLFSHPFVIEIKSDSSGWWIVNPLRIQHLKVGATKVSLEHKLSHNDHIQIDGHTIIFESAQKIERNQPNFRFQPDSDEALWRYLIDENEFDEILINGSKNIFVDWQGILLLSPWSFSNDQFIVDKIFQSTRVEGSWASWRISRRLRFQAALPPLVERPHIAIRKQKKFSLDLEQLERNKLGTPDQIAYLRKALEERKNIVVSGGTSTGKTVLLRALVKEMDPHDRILLLEEEAEIDWPHPHIVSLECGRGNLRQAVIESLRMRPTRLIVSEVRGAEAFEMLQAMNTGHSGSMTTIHANSTREAITRLESLVLSSGIALNIAAVRRMIAQAVEVIVQLNRDSNGERHIESISKIGGIQNETILFGDPLQIEPRGLKQK